MHLYMSHIHTDKHAHHMHMHNTHASTHTCTHTRMHAHIHMYVQPCTHTVECGRACEFIYESYHVMNIIKAREEYYGNPSCFLSSRILALATADRSWDEASVGPGVGGRCPSVGSSWRGGTKSAWSQCEGGSLVWEQHSEWPWKENWVLEWGLVWEEELGLSGVCSLSLLSKGVGRDQEDLSTSLISLRL